MSSKLRPLYDKMYMGLDVDLLALGAVRSARKRARTATASPELNARYRNVIRPYWKQFSVAVPPKYWYRNFGEDPRYIPNDLWFRRIVPYYNSILYAQALQDKCLHNIMVPGMKRPRTIVKNIAGVFRDDDLRPIPEDEAIARVHGNGRVLVKPSVGSGQGRNIRFYDSDNLTDDEIREIFRLYGRNFIMQEKVSQHPVLASLNPGSFNTIRVLSFMFRGEVHILSVILRVGSSRNEVDNFSRGGYQATVRADGSLDPIAITKQTGVWMPAEISDTGVRFADVKIPSFDAVLDAVRSASLTLPHFRIVGWDVGVDEGGDPVFIEYNVIPDQNQSTCGPTFGDLTDDVLAEVFGKKA